jgi:hypothetical protein
MEDKTFGNDFQRGFKNEDTGENQIGEVKFLVKESI